MSETVVEELPIIIEEPRLIQANGAVVEGIFPDNEKSKFDRFEMKGILSADHYKILHGAHNCMVIDVVGHRQGKLVNADATALAHEHSLIKPDHEIYGHAFICPLHMKPLADYFRK